MTTREELRSTQEEADTRVFLHAAQAAAAGYRAVVITSVDTDVFVLSLAFKGFISCPIFVKRSQQSQHTWMCQESFKCWGQNCVDLCLVSTPLLAATVSVLFRGKGKVTALKLVISNPISRNRHVVESYR